MTIVWIGIACIFGGALLGLALSRILPADHLSAESRDAVKVGAGMISLLAALVLGLLVSSAKGNFDAANAAITQGGAKVILLDRALAHYGPESAEVRADLREGVAGLVEMLWPEEHPTASGLSAVESARVGDRMLNKIRNLQPQTDAQRMLQIQALQLGDEIQLIRWLQIEQAQTSLPTAFLEILLFWLAMLYLSFGLIAPRNGTVVSVLFIGALSLATSLFLILEMNDPMSGVIKISSGPMRKALEHIGE